MAVFLILFKYYPMDLFGEDILFDASMHVTVTIFFLFSIWMFVPRKIYGKYFLSFATFIVLLMSIQRIMVGKHDYIGVSLGVILSCFSIWLSGIINKYLK